ncbi:MAG: hypothetical protein WDO71_14070 [Bacteroidota bacterium]
MRMMPGYKATSFHQEGLTISFTINGADFKLNVVGKHNMENALAASAIAPSWVWIFTISAEALHKYEGIYRRHQVLGNKNGVWVIDDFAHKPSKMRGCKLKPVSPLLQK